MTTDRAQQARSVALAGGGFLWAVLWFDLMFDVQVLGQGGGLLAEATLESMAHYYRRVTTDSWPMGALVALVMLVTIAAVVVQCLARAWPPAWSAALALLASMPIALALVRVLPNAARLGARVDSLDVQSELARAICREHLFCFVCIGLFVAVQLALPRRSG